MEPKINIPADALATFCLRWNVEQLSYFGSVLRDDFSADSDVDILVKFAPSSDHSLFDLVEMKQELEKLIGRNVDILTRQAVESSRNSVRRKAILESATVVFRS